MVQILPAPLVAAFLEFSRQRAASRVGTPQNTTLQRDATSVSTTCGGWRPTPSSECSVGHGGAPELNRSCGSMPLQYKGVVLRVP